MPQIRQGARLESLRCRSDRLPKRWPLRKAWANRPKSTRCGTGADTRRGRGSSSQLQGRARLSGLYQQATHRDKRPRPDRKEARLFIAPVQQDPSLEHRDGRTLRSRRRARTMVLGSWKGAAGLQGPGRHSVYRTAHRNACPVALIERARELAQRVTANRRSPRSSRSVILPTIIADKETPDRAAVSVPNLPHLLTLILFAPTSNLRRGK
jgi:hypothetical protein